MSCFRMNGRLGGKGGCVCAEQNAHRIERGGFAHTVSGNQNGLKYEDTNVTAGTSYQYRVRGRNYQGYGPFKVSNTVTAPAAAPGAIASVTAKAEPGKIVVTWSASANAKQYILQRRVKDATTWTTLKSTIAELKYEDTTGTAGTVYQYRVRGRNGTTYGPFKTSSVVRALAALPAPGAISSVTATPSAGKITVKWAKSDNAATYIIQRQTYGETTWTTKKTGLAALTWEDTAVTGGTKYRYRVRGVNSAGYGAFKVSSYATAQAASSGSKPGAISSVNISAKTGKITVAWTNSLGASAYFIQRQEDGGTWTTVNANYASTTYNDTAVTKGKTYAYRVRGRNGSAFGAYKVSASVTAK